MMAKALKVKMADGAALFGPTYCDPSGSVDRREAM